MEDLEAPAFGEELLEGGRIQAGNPWNVIGGERRLAPADNGSVGITDIDDVSTRERAATTGHTDCQQTAAP